MTATTEIRYLALKPLPLQTLEGERVIVQAGEEIPAVLCGSWINHSIEAGKVLEYVDGDLSTADDADLKAELETRGYKVTKAVRKAA